MLGGGGDLDYHGRDNVAVDRLGRPLPMFGRYTTTQRASSSTPSRSTGRPGSRRGPPSTSRPGCSRTPARGPGTATPHDVRILADVAEGRGKIIDSETEVGGYPTVTPTRRAFDPKQWNLEDDDAALAGCSRQ